MRCVRSRSQKSKLHTRMQLGIRARRSCPAEAEEKPTPRGAGSGMNFLVSLLFLELLHSDFHKNVLSLVIMKVHEKLRLDRPGIPCTAGP